MGRICDEVNTHLPCEQVPWRFLSIGDSSDLEDAKGFLQLQVFVDADFETASGEFEARLPDGREVVVTFTVNVKGTRSLKSAVKVLTEADWYVREPPGPLPAFCDCGEVVEWWASAPSRDYTEHVCAGCLCELAESVVAARGQP